MKVLVTGARGFIGRNLVEQLGSAYEILAPTRAELDLLDEDAVSGFLRRRTPDVVVHCATKPGHRNAPDPRGLVYDNTRMFFNLARCEDLFGRLVVLTSGAVYDERHYRPKMPEAYFDAHVPVDETGYSKSVVARHAARLARTVELRPFGVFGKYEDWEIRFISNAICKTLFDLPITLRQDRFFDYVFVDDLVRVVRHFIEYDASEKAYNVTPDRAVSLSDVARKVLEVSGKDLPVVIGLDGLGTEYSGNNSRLKAEVPGFPFTPLEEAVRTLYGWYAENRGMIRRDLLLVDK
jgi:UDP-glucose 4-epimerase